MNDNGLPSSYLKYQKQRKAEVRSLGEAIVALSFHPDALTLEHISRPIVEHLLVRLDNIRGEFDAIGKPLVRSNVHSKRVTLFKRKKIAPIKKK
jgi:hypothetical protein